MNKSIFFVSYLFLATSLVNAFPNGYLPDLSGIPFLSYFTYEDTPPQNNTFDENTISPGNEVLHANDLMPVDDLLDIIEEDKDNTNDTEKEKITKTLKSLKSSLADDTMERVKVLYRNVWHTINLGQPGSSERIRSAERADSLWERFVNMLARIRDAILELFGLKDPEKDDHDDESKNDKDGHSDKQDDKIVQPLDKKTNDKPEEKKPSLETKPPVIKSSEIKSPEIKPPMSSEAAKRTSTGDNSKPNLTVAPKPGIFERSKSLKSEPKDSDLGTGSEPTSSSNDPSKAKDDLSNSVTKNLNTLSDRDKHTADVFHGTESKTVTVKPTESKSGTMTVIGGDAASDPAKLAQMLLGGATAGVAAAKTEKSDDVDGLKPKHQVTKGTLNDDLSAGAEQSGKADDVIASKSKLTMSDDPIEGIEQVQTNGEKAANNFPLGGQKIEEKPVSSTTAASGGTVTENKNESFLEAVERLKIEIQGPKDEASKARMKQDLDKLFLNKTELTDGEILNITELLSKMAENGILQSGEYHMYGNKVMERNTKLKKLLTNDIDSTKFGKQESV